MLVCPQCGLRQEAGGFCPVDGTQLAPRGEDLLLGETLGQFRVARLLGVGGMGRVYLAVQPKIGSRVAVKVLSRECADSTDLVERFFSEARAVNLIRHENIVNVIDLATLPDGRPYIVMEYLDGAPLSDVMKRLGPLPLGSLARIAGEVLGALGAAHAASIVHRDLKPDNIYVTPQGRAKVLDFGIAKLRPEASGRSGPTRTGSLLGTPHYMAPEQAMAKRVDARADIYAIGVILYEGATGKKPLVADSLYELLHKQVEERPRPPRDLRDDLPAAYDALIMRTLEKDPALRFQTTGELANALAHATHGLPQEAWTPVTGVATGRTAQIGPPSFPTPTSGDNANTEPMPAPAPYMAGNAATPLPTPQAGELMRDEPAAPRSGGSRAPIFIGLSVAVVAIAAAVAIVLFMGGDDSAEVAGGADVAGEAGVEAEAPAQPAVGTEPATATDADSAAVAKTNETNETSETNETNEAGKQPALPTRAAVQPASEAPATVATKPRSTKNTPPKPTTASRPTNTASGPPKPVTPPPAVKKPKFAAFDVSGFIPRAQKMARKIYSDAVLVRIDAEGVRPNGKAELTLSEDFSVLYRFVSPSRSARPADLPIGVEHKPNCKIYVNVSSKGISVYPLEGWKCNEPLVGVPRCSARQVWKQGISQGAPSKNAVGSLGYWAGPGKKGRWHLDVGDVFSEWITDSC